MRLRNAIRVIPALLASFFAAEAQASLVAFYNFNEGSGTVANDTAGAINGTLTGNAAFVGGGITGGALSIDKDGYVTMGDNFNFAADFSVQTWIKLAPGDTSSENPIARHWAGVPAGYFVAINDVADGCSAIGKSRFFAGYPAAGFPRLP